MKLVKVAAAVVNQTPLDWEGNERRILEILEKARRQSVSIVCLPELCISGYGCEDAFHGVDVLAMSLRILKNILPATKGMIASVGLPLLHHNAIFNTACLLANGQVLGFVAKRYLAGDGIHYEPRWFKPWDADARTFVTIDGTRYPLGDLYFDCGGVRIGYEICEDAWVASRPGAEFARQGGDIILNPSASHFAFDKIEVRKRFVLEGSRAFGVTYVYANLLGNESGRTIFDGGALIASAGRLVAAGPRLSFADWHLTTAVIDVEATRMGQAKTSSFRPELGEDPEQWVRVAFTFPDVAPTVESVEPVSWETSHDFKEEEFTRATSLALFDYLRKSRANGFVISLSGGADSSAAACLVALMTELGAQELGPAGFLAKLRYIPGLTRATGDKEIVRALLTCVYQSTRNSTDTTHNAARAVAAALGAEFLELDVDGIASAYVTLVERALGRQIKWETDDAALQNIQARVRGPGAWMIANVKGALLLATSNRSEAAVGYATMDGDTCGGLSPIAGIDKAFLRRWLRWLETRGPETLHPIPALAAVNAQAPTAELRPAFAAQTDESDLMPYPILDAIERAGIRDKRPPIEVLDLLKVQFPDQREADLATYVERFFRLFSKNQWKRERYAPSFHLDDENLDPKTWCRFPILSGGFELELREMRGSIPPAAS